MVEDKDEIDDDVHISAELSGPYSAVMSKLSAETPESLVPDTMVEDVHRILETVVSIEGGTRSRIAESLPEEMNMMYDSTQVVEVLQVLEAYDLVVLEGNTWKPGPELEPRE